MSPAAKISAISSSRSAADMQSAASGLGKPFVGIRGIPVDYSTTYRESGKNVGAAAKQIERAARLVLEL
jgi:hypothetical protein